jgi:hypothetical protein
MSGWGKLRGVLSWRATAVAVGLVLAFGGLNVGTAAADDPRVPPTPPQVTATYNGAELGNCQVVASKNNIARTFENEYGSYQIRESLFAGPGGFLKLASTWEVTPGGLRLTTVIPMGGPR